MWWSAGAVGLGAALGAILRWQLSVRLPMLWHNLPGGTLAANLGGAFLIGIASGFFLHHPGLAPQWRLFAVTGFLGGLTTFSTFSAESMALLQSGQAGAALLHSALHLGGSVLLCFAGLMAYRALS
ncbi:fluoride efflux transporter CrcB [Massilia sp. W12]|uniref:fluoride efflux transporter CrcB n=1 Tax=Massilia sp. W12 TaxID=3126507 RepID=UPI0030CBD628